MEDKKNYTTYHPSQAKANKKYYNEHKEEIYEKFKEKLKNDPEFKQKRLEYARRSREKKKLLQIKESSTQIKESSTEIISTEIISTEIIPTENVHQKNIIH